MSIQEELFSASFRGIPFLVTTGSTTGGRKTATHEFVNSSRRNIEDLGKLLKTFTITAVITGNDYFQERDRLITALETPGSGVLEHPFYGRVEVVLSEPYQLSEDMTTLGEAVFTLVFKKADDRVMPQPERSSEAEVSQLTEASLTNLAEDTASDFVVPLGFQEAFDNASTLMTDIGASFNGVETLFSPSLDTVSSFSSSLQAFTDDTNELINTPLALGNSIKGLFDQTILIVTSVDDRLDVLRGFFGFNETSETLGAPTLVGNAISEEAAVIINNQNILTRQMRASALVYAYEAVALTEFETVAQIDTATSILNAQYQDFISDVTLSPTTRETIQLLRDKVEILLANKRVDAQRITDITINPQPLQVLTYSLYADLTLTSALLELNNLTDISQIEGTIEVLTS